MEGITRKPIKLNNRRNAEYNPEFLDMDYLLLRFNPLIQSIAKYFISYDGMFEQKCEIEDLYAVIQFQFVELVRKFDPNRGVDFTGYIKFHLRQRVYHYVTKLQKQQGKEKLLHIKEDTENDNMSINTFKDNYVEEVDDKWEEEFNRSEAIASIPWDKITDPEQLELINMFLIQRKPIEEYALEKKVSIKSVSEKLEKLCELLRKECAGE